MFNIGSGEIALIAVVALLILGPSRLPELARGIGKFMREFRRQTDEVRGVVEREFYKMDADEAKTQLPLVRSVKDSVPTNPYPTPSEEEAMAAPADQLASQLTKGAPQGEAVTAPAPAAPATAPATPATAPATPAAEGDQPAAPAAPTLKS